MRKILLILVTIFTTHLNAQIQTPQPSPKANLKQIVGLTTIKIDYSRPAMRDREVFGNLVPFDKVWRTGANENSVIHFEHDVKINQQMLEAGSYAIYTKPSKNNWEVYFYEKTDNWGLPQEWDASKIAASAIVPVKKLSHKQESFTIGINEIKNDYAHLQISWENTLVEVPIHFITDELVTESIDSVMNGPSANDYYNAAVYYMTADKDISLSVKWIEKAVSMMDATPYWVLRQQSLIYAKAGNKKKAISVAEKSLKAAEKAGNSDYIKMNKESLAEWK
ncbi:DUF2911 domain-containing protein [Psychroflexus halocasei]|uniref:Dihydrolipoamide dehydrogenase n=1 Tax=Psychroflexus halocasei TaxID=908615 RepID=A0A1H3Y5F8_9FLAO|nr:DUF2911 domain-containing protein [Psychroflexus halocasei]SEA06947.1 Protein of unknown function [Psychroflexus halocasei]